MTTDAEHDKNDIYSMPTTTMVIPTTIKTAMMITTTINDNIYPQICLAGSLK
jgi:hypothetical protein